MMDQGIRVWSSLSVRRSLAFCTVLALAVLAGTVPARSTTVVTYSFSSGSGATLKSATAGFSLTGTTLTVVITNTGAAAKVPADTLAGIFLNLSNTSNITSADTIALTSGSSVVNSVSQDVNGQWFYAPDTADHAGYNEFISSVGLNSGTKDYFGMGSGDNGINYGLVNGIDANANGGVTGKPWISKSVTLGLIVTASFSLDQLGNTILFQYGSSNTEPSFEGHPETSPVPEPSTIALSGIAGIICLGAAWRHRRSAKP